ncbi:Putative malate dehydrogenase 1B, partial [Habropoda laboriosa]
FQPWLKEICEFNGWSHDKSPLIWREIGLTGTYINYIGGSFQFWKLLHDYYNISSYLSKEDLDALQADLLLVGKRSVSYNFNIN